MNDLVWSLNVYNDDLIAGGKFTIAGGDTVNYIARWDKPAPDTDGDSVPDYLDNCVDDYNPGQANADGDDFGDICDVCPNDPDDDADGDGLCGDIDNCPDCGYVLDETIVKYTNNITDW